MFAKVWQDSDTPHTSLSRNNPVIFCVTCLSTSNVRKMYPIGDNTFFSSITLIQVPSNSNFKVCWECNAMLEKIKKFRLRALQAHYIMNKNKKLIKMPSPLTTLVRNNLNNWVSIVYSKVVFSPLHEETPDIPISTSLKEEIIENQPLRFDTEGAYFVEEDPFLMHSEVDIKIDEVPTKEDERGCMDIIKCEYDNSSDDEPLITKAKTHLEIVNHQTDDSSETDSATELPESPKSPSPSIDKTTMSPLTQNMPKSLPKPPSLQVPDPSSSLELPLAFVASSLLTNSLPKPAESTTQRTSQDKHKPVQYHSGPKLFKNSPQLAIPEMFRNIEPPKQTTYVIRRMTQEQVNEYRADRTKRAKDRHWELFCVKCLDMFTRRRDYEAHLKKHERSAGAFVCPVCELRYPTQKERDEHKDLHYRLYVCDVCKKEFYTMPSLIRHNDLIHEDVLKFCRHCDQRFTNKKEFYMHNRTHLQRVQCEYCHKQIRRNRLKQHITDIHGPKPFLECEVCHKIVEGKKKLRSHIRNSHRPVEDSGYCVECNVSYKSQALYLMHLKTTMKHRADQDKFPCPRCERVFSTSWYLKKHISVQHENSEMSECDICKKVYRSKKAIRSHIMTQHLKLKSPSERRNKVCDFCGKAFMTKACLDQHRNSHLKIRPYKCEECGATFSYSGARYTHIKLKHRKKQTTATSKHPQ